MKSFILLLLLISLAAKSHAQSDPPELTSWMRNTTGVTGYNSLPANVQQVRYSTGYVYVSSSGIPVYDIGPWGRDPNVPANQHFVFKFPRFVAKKTSGFVATPLGPEAVWINGVAAYNAKDANSYNNGGVWHTNAVVVEAADFDSCFGHADQQGIYHHHQNPRCLYTGDSTALSPIIGYAFDGAPIYGPFSTNFANGTGTYRHMRSSYRLRNITERTTLADGTALTAAQYGPPVSAQYPLGYYVEDYEYVPGLGDLDAHNGRFGVTKEYPQGVYAYYVTIDSTGASAYPYVMGPTYIGEIAEENITQHGHVTVSEQVTEYSPAANVAPARDASLPAGLRLEAIAPDPVNRASAATVNIAYALGSSAVVSITVLNMLGEEIQRIAPATRAAGAFAQRIDLARLRPGAYAVRVSAGTSIATRLFVVR